MKAEREALLRQWRQQIEANEAEAPHWRNAMRHAARGDPSQLALLLTRARIPPSLIDEVYRLIIAAPWRDKGGRPLKVDQVGRTSIAALYGMLALGGDNGRRLTRSQIIDALVHQFRVSKSTIEGVLREQCQKPPRVSKPQVRR